jgi:tRNA G10  N-methylase Trm11
MAYFFVLGNNPTLSVAEIFAKFNLEKEKYHWADRDILVWENKRSIDFEEAIRTMGGTVKIGEVIQEIQEKELEAGIISILEGNQKKTGQNKFKFGISFYGKDRLDIKGLAMNVKKRAKECGLSCKWAGGKEKTLSSVAVEKNRLIDGGVEVVLFKKNKECYFLGRTLAVQPFEDLSFRDYGRPARDDRSGLLPPKLAQIMINLAGFDRKAVLADPFCGSGTVLTEALLMGYRNFIGTDASSRATCDTKKNIQWIAEHFGIKDHKGKIYEKQAVEISSILKENSIDIIVTEPFLGPQRGKHSRSKTARNLSKMYSEALDEFSRILKPAGKIVMVWPVFVAKKNFHNDLKFIFLELKDFKIKKILPEKVAKNPYAKLTKRGTIIYGRSGQKVWREIVVLKKN